MALDVGKIRVGVALSDGLGLTAQPLLTLWRKNRTEDLRSLLRLIRKHDVQRIVVGNPLHLSGEVSAWAEKVHEFAHELQRRCELPVEFWDERLSTAAAHDQPMRPRTTGLARTVAGAVTGGTRGCR